MSKKNFPHLCLMVFYNYFSSVVGSSANTFSSTSSSKVSFFFKHVFKLTLNWIEFFCTWLHINIWLGWFYFWQQRQYWADACVLVFCAGAGACGHHPTSSLLIWQWQISSCVSLRHLSSSSPACTNIGFLEKKVTWSFLWTELRNIFCRMWTKERCGDKCSIYLPLSFFFFLLLLQLSFLPFIFLVSYKTFFKKWRQTHCKFILFSYSLKCTAFHVQIVLFKLPLKVTMLEAVCVNLLFEQFCFKMRYTYPLRKKNTFKLFSFKFENIF